MTTTDMVTVPPETGAVRRAARRSRAVLWMTIALVVLAVVVLIALGMSDLGTDPMAGT